MSRLLFEKTFPRASTCVLLGAPPEGIDLRAYRRLLWCTTRGDASPPPATLPPAALERLAIESLAPGQFAAALERFVRHDPRHLPSLFASESLLASHGAALERILGEAHQVLEANQRARVTRQKDGFPWQHHVLRNLDAYLTRRLPPVWAGALAAIPAFVCGAGPSLDVSLPALVPHASRGVIFSADSALRALARHGLQADFAVSIDVAKVPEKCLPDTLPPQRVILSPVSPPAWTSALPRERQFFVTNNQVTLDWLTAQGVSRTPISAQENCGATALQLAHFLGCSPIYLFGLDLAAAGNQRHHGGVDASLYSNSGYDAAHDLPEVPGNYCESLPTFAYGDWYALNERLGTWPAGLVHNVNDRGVRFQNVVLQHPSTFGVDAPPEAKHAPLSTLPDAAPPAATALIAAEQGLSRLRERGRETVKRARAALQQHGAAGAAQGLRQLLMDPTAGALLGAFSLKLMPHLVPPVEGDAAFWSTLLSELEVLLGSAAPIPPGVD